MRPLDLAAAGVALLAAVAFAVATVAQQRAAARSTDDEARGAGFVLQLLRRPQWWAGTLGNTLGYALQAVALGLGSLLIVQPILVTSLLFALPLGARFARQRLPRSAWIWGALLVVSLAAFVALAHPDRGLSRPSGVGWLVAAAIVVPLVAGCVVAAHFRTGALRAGLLAIAVGLLAGVLAVLTKDVAVTATDGVLALAASPTTYVLVVVGLSGVYLQQLAFQAGALAASLPIIAVLEPMSAGVLGLALLHERLSPTAVTAVVLVVAVLVMAVATVALARNEAAAAVAPDALVEGRQQLPIGLEDLVQHRHGQIPLPYERVGE